MRQLKAFLRRVYLISRGFPETPEPRTAVRARVHVCVNVCARARTEARASALLSVAVSVAAEFLRLAKWLVLGFGPERTTALHF